MLVTPNISSYVLLDTKETVYFMIWLKCNQLQIIVLAWNTVKKNQLWKTAYSKLNIGYWIQQTGENTAADEKNAFEISLTHIPTAVGHSYTQAIIIFQVRAESSRTSGLSELKFLWQQQFLEFCSVWGTGF